MLKKVFPAYQECLKFHANASGAGSNPRGLDYPCAANDYWRGNGVALEHFGCRWLRVRCYRPEFVSTCPVKKAPLGNVGRYRGLSAIWAWPPPAARSRNGDGRCIHRRRTRRRQSADEWNAVGICARSVPRAVWRRVPYRNPSRSCSSSKHRGFVSRSCSVAAD
jgi:hypothetical protein